MKLKSNFVQDWQDYLKNILVNDWGYDLSKIDEQNVVLSFFNAKQRLIEKRPRKLKISDVFHCPEKHQKGWDKFQKDIFNGNYITPHLSCLIDSINYKDLMLNDWGVYHFHLGYELKGNFVERTGPLLFALVTNEYLYAINVYSHSDWTNTDVVEVIHRNWPELIKQHMANGITCNWTDTERKELRKDAINIPIKVSDGTVYLPISGGMVGSRDSMKTLGEMHYMYLLVKGLQSTLESQLNSLLPVLKKQGYDGESELIVNLEITENEYRAVFPEYSLVVTLDIAWESGVQLE